MALQADTQAFIEVVEAARAEGPSVAEQTPEFSRDRYQALAHILGEGPEVPGGVADIEIPGPAGPIPARIYRPNAEGPHPVLVFFHGGGFVIGDLDTHDKDGSHWVALFVNLSKPTVYENRKYDGYIFYYDSYGMEATEEINILANRLIQQASNLSKPLNLVYVQNDVRHQYGGSECGVYCMHFILRNLKGKSINFIKEKRISDSDMNKFRKYFFVSNK